MRVFANRDAWFVIRITFANNVEGKFVDSSCAIRHSHWFANRAVFWRNSKETNRYESIHSCRATLCVTSSCFSLIGYCINYNKERETIESWTNNRVLELVEDIREHRCKGIVRIAWGKRCASRLTNIYLYSPLQWLNSCSVRTRMAAEPPGTGHAEVDVARRSTRSIGRLNDQSQVVQYGVGQVARLRNV